MNDLKCQIQSHKGKEINTICLDKDCKNTRLCCLLCIKNFHTQHVDKLVEVDEMNAFIQQESKQQGQNPESCSYGQKQVIQGLEKISGIIDTFQKMIMEKILNIKQQNLHNYLQNNSNQQQGIEDWNQLLEGILEYVEVDDCFVNKKIFQEGQLNEIEEKQIRIIKQSEESMLSIINQINQTFQKSAKLCFLENKKHADIVLIDEFTIKKNNQSSCSMAFAGEGFDPSTQSYSFAFNIQNITNNVIVGVGNDEVAKQNSFIIAQWTELGHGQYMINHSNKQTYHHTDGQINNKAKGINFQAGDKIQIKYDHVTKVLEFRSSSDSNAVVKMTITDMTKKLYPSAQLCQIGDSVQIVKY